MSDEAAGRSHPVRQGDSVESIAYRTGHFWEKVWNHGDNAELRKRRKNPNVLMPGDRVFVPPIEQKSEDLATSKTHRFRRKGVPSRLRIRFLRDGEPRKSEAYVIEIDGEERHGTTDGDGFLDEPVSPVARRAIVRFEAQQPEDPERDSDPATGGDVVMGEPATEREEGETNGERPQEVFAFRLGHLDPSDEVTGAQGRLRNLGFDLEVDGELGPRTRDALATFQDAHGLDPTGELDDATQSKLAEAADG